MLHIALAFDILLTDVPISDLDYKEPNIPRINPDLSGNCTSCVQMDTELQPMYIIWFSLMIPHNITCVEFYNFN